MSPHAINVAAASLYPDRSEASGLATTPPRRSHIRPLASDQSVTLWGPGAIWPTAILRAMLSPCWAVQLRSDRMKRGLFLKYVVLFVGLVTGVLVINAALGLWFVYQENRRASIEVQHEKAEAAAQNVESFVREIERQIGWVAQAQWATLPVEQRRFDYVRLQRQVPAITELVQLDRQGREQLKVSRITMDVVGTGTDLSRSRPSSRRWPTGCGSGRSTSARNPNPT